MSEYVEYKVDNNFKTVKRGRASCPAQMTSKLCYDLFAWWHDYEPGMPTRKDFDVLDHVKAMGNIFLVEVKGEGIYEYRIQGEEVAELVGTRNQGKVFTETCEDKDMASFARYLNEFIYNGIAVHSFGTLAMLERSYVKFEAVDVPLGDADGNITHVLGLITRVD